MLGSQSVNQPVHQLSSQIDSHSIGMKAIQSVSKASQLISQSIFQFVSQLLVSHSVSKLVRQSTTS